MTDAAKAVEAKDSMRYRVYFWEHPGDTRKHNSTWADQINAKIRARELEDKGFGTQIITYDSDFPATAPPARLTAVEESAKPTCPQCLHALHIGRCTLLNPSDLMEVCGCEHRAPGDVREGVTRWDCDSNHRGIAFMRECEAGPFVTYKSYLAALQQVAELNKDNANLKEMFELHKSLITKCLCAGIVFQGDDEPLINDSAEKAEAELSRLRGELKEREK